LRFFVLGSNFYYSAQPIFKFHEEHFFAAYLEVNFFSELFAGVSNAIKKSNTKMMLLLTYSQSNCWILIVDKSEK